ncbi:hypothetical protein [Micromonospora sp. NPDC005189]|uniref:hypothetical protein n=1 Tax=unclassified Micromonospora TaxID=2617518 RepID=UPI00339ECE9B
MTFTELRPQLTIEEKAALCLGSTFWHIAPVPRPGIPAIMVSDGPHGLHEPERNPDQQASIFQPR